MKTVPCDYFVFVLIPVFFIFPALFRIDNACFLFVLNPFFLRRRKQKQKSCRAHPPYHDGTTRHMSSYQLIISFVCSVNLRISSSPKGIAHGIEESVLLLM